MVIRKWKANPIFVKLKTPQVRFHAVKNTMFMQEPRTLYPADPKMLLKGRGFFGGYRQK